MKKILSLILIAVMAVSMIPCSAIADTGNTVIEIINVPGYQADVNHNALTVTPEINVISGEIPATYKYQWYEGNNGENILPWETGESITIHSQLPPGAWLWVEVTPLDSEGNAIGDSIKVKYISTYPMKGRNETSLVTAEQSEQWKNTPSEYLFEVDGVKFILLDRLHNGQYYVMMENSVGARAFDTRGETKLFDPSAPENIGYWLNNDFLSDGYLPDTVKTYITEENWTTEGDNTGWGNTNKTYKVGLLSYSEYNRYLGRFGLLLPQYDSSNMKSWEGFWLRTIRNGTRAFASAKNGGTDNGSGILGNLGYFTQTISLFVRPTFRLSADFFTSTRIELESAGSKVKETIADCDLAELENLYSREELIENDIIKRPVIKGIDVKGNFVVGDTVKGDYIWFSENNIEEGESDYGFSISDNEEGPYTNVLTNSKEYTISDEAMGKYLTFYVIPNDENGVSGECYRSKPILISETAKVVVTDSSLNGQTVSITLKNLTENKNEDVIVMATTYDTENKINGTYAIKVNVPANDTVTFDNLSLDEESVSATKIMVWESLESMKVIYCSDM